MSAPALPHAIPAETNIHPASSILPSIRMPRSSPVLPTGEYRARETDEALLTTTSYASEDSFATAFTSGSSPPKSKPATTSIAHESSSQSLLNPRTLNKSVSVDSFIKYRREQQSKPNPDPSWATVQATQRDSVIDPDMTRWRSQGHIAAPKSMHPLPGRLRPENGRPRGSSLSTVVDDFNDSSLEDSDADIANNLVKRREGGRRRATRTKGTGVPQPGELALPSRLQSLSTNPSFSNLKTANTAGLRIRQSASGLSSPSIRSQQERNATTPTPETSSRAERSDSPGHRPSKVPGIAGLRDGRRIMINTANLKLRDFSELVIAVVGAAGCGKSTLIRKSLKNYGLTESEPCVTVEQGSSSRVTVTSRTARIIQKSSPSETSLKVLEVDSQSLLDGEKTSIWPAGYPSVDGVLVCYDASDRTSVSHLAQLLSGFHDLEKPTIVVACKSDLDKGVLPSDALHIVQNYAGIVEVTDRNEGGKTKMWKCVDHLLRAIQKQRAASWNGGSNYQNPASPSVFTASAPPWDNAGPTSVAHTASSSMSTIQPHGEYPASLLHTSTLPGTRTPRSPTAPTSPTRARSTNDLLSEHQKSIAKRDGERVKTRSIGNLSQSANNSVESTRVVNVEPADSLNPLDDALGEKQEGKGKEPPPPPWATLEELLDKLFFLSVSGDDPAFITHFFLTYRRFATPRSILLGMQKRMIELSEPSDDFMLASFAQMRICNLLENWMKDYPSDFAVPNTSGALSALTRQTLSHTHTLHYGSDFLPFIEMLPQQVDQDASWALKAEDISVESDDSDSMFGEDNESDMTELDSPVTTSPLTRDDTLEALPDVPVSGRERKFSLPLSAKSILQVPAPNTSAGRSQLRSTQSVKPVAKEILPALVKQSQKVLNVNAAEIAGEITRIEADLFLKIEPRHWLRHTLVSGKKNPEHDPIAVFHSFYNHVHDWAVSLILCHDKPKARARQMEHFAEVAVGLRALNNYSGLRAVITAISNSTFQGDQPMELFKQKTDLYKKFQSSDILLHSTGAYRSYRLALRNTKGPCIPALEVHMSDLLRAHEGNPDTKPDDPSKIHWAKFNMIGKFIGNTSQYQAQCRDPNEYNFTENKVVAGLLDIVTMDYDMQQTRISAPSDFDGVDSYASPHMVSHHYDGFGHTKDSGGTLRRLFSGWS